MSHILQSVPVGQKVGLAFSGGSTRARRCIGCARKARFLRVHREPGPARRERLRRDPAQGAAVRRREGAPRRLPRGAGRGGHRRVAGGRVSHLDRGPHVLQHDADRPRRDRHDARHRDARRRRPHLGRRQHYKGNDIERFYRYGLLANPDCASTSRGSTPRSSTSSAAARRCRSTSTRRASATR